MSIDAAGSTSGLRTAVRGAWSWWLRELRPLVPNVVATLMVPARPVLRVVVEGSLFTFATKRRGRFQEIERIETVPGVGLTTCPETKRLTELVRRKGLTVTLRAPPDQLVRRILNYPMAARRDLRTILRHQLDRLIPYTAEEVYFEGRILREDHRTKRLELELQAIPRSTVDDLVDQLAACSLKPESLDPTVDDAQSGHSITLTEPVEPGLKARLRNGALAALVLVNGVFVLALAGMPTVELARQEAVLEDQVATAKAKVVVVDHLRTKVEHLHSETQFLVDWKSGLPTRIEVLNAVTRLLPDTDWVNHLSIRVDQIEVKGISANAASLIGAIENSPLFTNARFRAPVVPERDGPKEQFHILADILPGAET